MPDKSPQPSLATQRPTPVVPSRQKRGRGLTHSVSLLAIVAFSAQHDIALRYVATTFSAADDAHGRECDMSDRLRRQLPLHGLR